MMLWGVAMELWTYTLDMRYGLWHIGYRLQAWNPQYGARTWEQWEDSRTAGPLTASQIYGDIWSGAQTLIERGTAH